MSNFAYKFTTREPVAASGPASLPQRTRKNSFAAASAAEVITPPGRAHVSWGTLAPRHFSHFDFRDGTSVVLRPDTVLGRKLAEQGLFANKALETFKAIYVRGECFLESSPGDSKSARHYPNGLVLVQSEGTLCSFGVDHFVKCFSFENGKVITDLSSINSAFPRK